MRRGGAPLIKLPFLYKIIYCEYSLESLRGYLKHVVLCVKDRPCIPRNRPVVSLSKGTCTPPHTHTPKSTGNTQEAVAPFFLIRNLKPLSIFCSCTERIEPDPESIKLFKCSTHLSIKFILLIDVDRPKENVSTIECAGLKIRFRIPSYRAFITYNINGEYSLEPPKQPAFRNILKYKLWVLGSNKHRLWVYIRTATHTLSPFLSLSLPLSIDCGYTLEPPTPLSISLSKTEPNGGEISICHSISANCHKIIHIMIKSTFLYKIIYCGYL